MLLEAAQLPRSREDVDFSVINGNFAASSGIPFSSGLFLERSYDFINWVVVKSADAGKPFAKDVAAAYNSPNSRLMPPSASSATSIPRAGSRRGEWRTSDKNGHPGARFYWRSVVAQPPAGGQEGGEAAKQGACQHIQGPVHADKGAREADPDGPERQQPGPGGCPASQIRPKNWARLMAAML